PGDWRMSAMDIGQGSAISVETASQALSFDAGPRHFGGGDAGERVIAPQSQARGIGQSDVSVSSHADSDHVGGTRSVSAAVPVARSYASFDVAAWSRRDARLWPEPRAEAGTRARPPARASAAAGAAHPPHAGPAYRPPSTISPPERG
ncbi:hypothetical protein OY671_012729, partial [Metschnikowia pulcherrima]